MDNHSRKRSHLLSPHRKPIKHTLLESHYIEKQKEDPAIKRQNPRITQFVLVAVCSLSLIGTVCWIMFPKDKRTSATAYQPSPSPTGMFTSRSKPNILIELDEQQSSKPHTLVAIAGNVNNQPQPKQQATTAAIPLPSADNTPEPPSSSTTPDTPAEPPKPQEPTTPTTPQPDDPPPAGDTSPACRPSIWNLFWCGD